jgi:hypothetical protein
LPARDAIAPEGAALIERFQGGVQSLGLKGQTRPQRPDTRVIRSLAGFVVQQLPSGLELFARQQHFSQEQNRFDRLFVLQTKLPGQLGDIVPFLLACLDGQSAGDFEAAQHEASAQERAGRIGGHRIFLDGLVHLAVGEVDIAHLHERGLVAGIQGQHAAQGVLRRSIWLEKVAMPTAWVRSGSKIDRASAYLPFCIMTRAFK